MRLLVHVEGQTEETFVNQILRPHLADFGYTQVSARLLGNARVRARRGGIRPWPDARKDIVRHLQQDGEALAGLMVDYYALPASGSGAWPGRFEALALPHAEKAVRVQEALSADIEETIGGGFNSTRFIPYVMMHEFEGLLFSDCARLAQAVNRTVLGPLFQNVRNQFASPEHINDSPQTSPSKRILALMPDYQKVLHGTQAIQAIGLSGVRGECQTFDVWLRALESKH